MAVVTVNLGTGISAALSSRAPTGALSLQQRRDADEFLRCWPKAAVGPETHQARSYVQQLRLHAAYSAAGGAGGDAVALLRAAVNDGRVVVSIARSATRSGSGAAPTQPVAQRMVAAGPSFQPYSALASDGGASMALPIGATSSASGFAGGFADFAAQAMDAITSDVATPLGGGSPLAYEADAPSGVAEQLAASTNNPNHAASMLGYDRKVFGNMIHDMKSDLGLGGADNVTWHDDGTIVFRKEVIGNMHDYAK